MTKSNVEQIVKELAKANFAMYPQSYLVEYPERTTKNISELAANFFENRTELDVQRDDKALVDIIDYERWCAEAYEAMQNN